jgi:competence protein ComEC
MRDIFTPVFLVVLAGLYWVDAAVANPFVFKPLALVVFAAFLVLFYFKKYKTAYSAIVLALALLFCGAFLKQKDAFNEDREVRFPPGEYVIVRGTLLAYPEIGNESSRLLLRARSFQWSGHRLKRTMAVVIRCQGDCRGFNRGDSIEAAARLQPQRLSTNFSPNPFEKYLLVNKLAASGYSKSVQLLRLTAKTNLCWRLIGAWRERVRRAIERRFQRQGRLLPSGVFLEATVLGDRGRLEASTQEELIGSGVFHLLAISGANIGLLALFSLLLCRWLGVAARPRYLATSLLLVLFLALSGFDISAQRAVLMGLLLFFARAYFLDVQLSNIVSCCGLLLLAFNPALFLDPGYVLTFALTAALLSGRRIFLPLLKKLPRYAAELLAANVSATLLALPLSLYFFQRFALASIFSGLLLVPLAGAITVCGALLLFLAPLGAAVLAMVPAAILLDVFFSISRWFYGHLAWNIFRPSPPLWLLAAIGTLFFLVSLAGLKVFWRGAAGVALAGILLFIALPVRPYRPGRLEAYFLDVGHGDSEVIVFPGGDALLVDGGGSSYSDFQVGRRIVLPFLIQKRIRVRWAAVSHFHPDHARGLAEIIAILAPEELWLSASLAADDYYRQLLTNKPSQTSVKKIQRGFVKEIGDCSIACLSPPRFIEADAAQNDHSMVLAVTDSRAAFLVPGDIEAEAESELAASFGPGLAASVLKIAHHASRTSSSVRFLDLVNPRLAVISAPAYSSYGFPHPEVIWRLRRRHIRWLSTARSGGIMVAASPAGLEIVVSK